MARVRLPKLSRSTAEQALARLWCRLEAEGIESPEIKIEFGPGDAVDISLSFANPAHAVLAWIPLEAHRAYSIALRGAPP